MMIQALAHRCRRQGRLDSRIAMGGSVQARRSDEQAFLVDHNGDLG